MDVHCNFYKGVVGEMDIIPWHGRQHDIME